MLQGRVVFSGVSWNGEEGGVIKWDLNFNSYIIVCYVHHHLDFNRYSMNISLITEEINFVPKGPMPSCRL